jgi:hypothetical protein
MDEDHSEFEEANVYLLEEVDEDDLSDCDDVADEAMHEAEASGVDPAAPDVDTTGIAGRGARRQLLDPEASIVARGRTRVRFCLGDCDCERPRGRKCECERRGNGLCTLACLCDRTKCRTTARDLSDEDD